MVQCVNLLTLKQYFKSTYSTDVNICCFCNIKGITGKLINL